jgi:mRNA interferase YafQ
MLSVSYSARFKKDLKREVRDSRNRSLNEDLRKFLLLLTAGLSLPERFHEHQLTGNYKGHFEAHLKPDLLIIYTIDVKSGVTLIRLGSHSDLF